MVKRAVHGTCKAPCQDTLSSSPETESSSAASRPKTHCGMEDCFKQKAHRVPERESSSSSHVKGAAQGYHISLVQGGRSCRR